MLSPGDRRLLLDALSPPAGYRLDQAIGTTYTLDLLALLRVPLAATALPWADRSGSPVNNPFALLAALRANAQRVSLFCHAGATSVPARHVPLLAFLEEAVVPVTPPQDGAVFHPKIWLLRFLSEDDDDEPVTYRLLVLSRNLTFDRAWDAALVLDGQLARRSKAANRPLSEFVAALPGMAEAAGSVVSRSTRERAQLLATEVRRVDWDLPEGFWEVAFHPLGHRAGTTSPITDLRRLMIISPFVSREALEDLRAQVREDMHLISRFDELTRLEPETLSGLASVEAFDDAAGSLDADEDGGAADGSSSGTELAGLHAKVYVGEHANQAFVWVGSANATAAAFGRNVEFVVELLASPTQHGVDTVMQGLADGGLLNPFVAGERAPEEPVRDLERSFERVAHALATALVARATEVPDVGWRISISATKPVEIGDLTAQLRPLAVEQWRPLEPTADPACEVVVPSAASVSAFFALRLSGRVDGTLHHHDVTVRLPLEGAPTGRIEAVTADLLNDRDRLLRFILVLLSDDGDVDGMLDQLERTLVEGDGKSHSHRPSTDSGLPLLEPMLKALHRDPDRLDEIDRLLQDIEAAGGDAGQLVPDDLRSLWSKLTELREARR